MKLNGLIFILIFVAFSCKKSKDDGLSPTNPYTGVKSISLKLKRYTYDDTVYTGTAVKYTMIYDGKRITSAVPDTDPSHIGTIYLTYNGNNVASVYRTMLLPNNDTAISDSLGFVYSGDKIATIYHSQRGFNNAYRVFYKYQFVYNGNAIARVEWFSDTSANAHFYFTGDDKNVSRISMGNSNAYTFDYTSTDLQNNLASSVPIWAIMWMAQADMELIQTYPMFMNTKLVNACRNVLNSDNRRGYSYDIKDSRVTKRVTEDFLTGTKDTVSFGY